MEKMYMEQSYLEKYENKTELQKLQIFLTSVQNYCELLNSSISLKELVETIGEPFWNYALKINLPDLIDKNESTIEQEEKKFGIDIEYDAVADACIKLQMDASEVPVIQRHIREMRRRK